MQRSESKIKRTPPAPEIREDDEYDEEAEDLIEAGLLDGPGPLRFAGHVGRNDPCPCGSGKKFKKCCLKKPRDGRVIE